MRRGVEMTLDAALRDITSADPRVRATAAGALGTVDADPANLAVEGAQTASDVDRARAALRPALKDDISDVRYAASLSLGELHDRESVPALIDQLEDGDRMARQAAVIALGMIGDPAAFEVLARVLKSGPPEVRFQAASALVEIDRKRAFEHVAEATSDLDPEVRAQAAAALGDLGDDRGRGYLAARLDDAVAPVRLEAALALARLEDRRAIPVLAEFAAHDDHGLAALQALVQLAPLWVKNHDAPAIPAARRVMDRFFAPPVLKVWAAAVLAAAGDPRGEQLLGKLGKHRRADVRGSVEEAREALAGPKRPETDAR